MNGPEDRGHCTATHGPISGSSHAILRAGTRHRVIIGFHDYDGDLHREGESWEFLGYAFLPYEDAYSFFVSLDGEHEWHIRLQHRPEQQAHIREHLSDFVGSESAG